MRQIYFFLFSTIFYAVGFGQPANDNCTNAEALAITTSFQTVNFDINSAVLNNETGCVGTTNDYADVWYDITIPADGNLFINGSISRNNFALYNSCGGTEIACSQTSLFLENVSATDTYKLRVFRDSGTAGSSSFQSFVIGFYEQTINDTCPTAENLTITTSAQTVNFDIAGSDPNNEVGCSSNTPEDISDIWYNFTMPVNGNLYVNGDLNWNNFALYDVCNGTEIVCSATNLFAENLTASTNYLLRVFRNRDVLFNNNFRSFTIQAFEVINNDDCASAETITVSTTQNTINFGIAGAMVNNEVGCNGTPAEDYADVWYEFIMTQNGNIEINGQLSWNNFALYDTCSGTELGCFNTSGMFSNLANGTTYKLRVFRTTATQVNDSFKSFNIAIQNTLENSDVKSENKVLLFPNPAQNEVKVLAQSNTLINIKLFDLTGKRLLITENEVINISNLSEGIYLLKIETILGISTKRLIINR